MLRLRTIQCVCFAATTLLAGCMALPFASWQAHEYEGKLAPNPIFAVEDGRRVEFALDTVTQRQNSPYNVHPAPVLVERVGAGPTTQLTWTGKGQLDDHRLLGRIHDESPLYRRPQGVGRTLSYEPTLVPWDAGYVVATRPFAVAFPLGLNAFAIAQRELARGELPTRKTTSGFVRWGSAHSQMGATRQQYNFIVPWVEPGALSVRVDVVQVLADADTLRVIRLKAPVTIDGLLDLMATPGGLDGQVAEEIRQPRTLPASARDAPSQHPRL